MQRRGRLYADRRTTRLASVGRGLLEIVDLCRIGPAELSGDRPHLDVLVALIKVRAGRAGRDPHCGGRAVISSVEEVHRQRSAREEVDLLDLLVVVAGALLEVRVRGIRTKVTASWPQSSASISWRNSPGTFESA